MAYDFNSFDDLTNYWNSLKGQTFSLNPNSQTIDPMTGQPVQNGGPGSITIGNNTYQVMNGNNGQYTLSGTSTSNGGLGVGQADLIKNADGTYTVTNSGARQGSLDLGGPWDTITNIVEVAAPALIALMGADAFAGFSSTVSGSTAGMTAEGGNVAATSLADAAAADSSPAWTQVVQQPAATTTNILQGGTTQNALGDVLSGNAAGASGQSMAAPYLSTVGQNVAPAATATAGMTAEGGQIAADAAANAPVTSVPTTPTYGDDTYDPNVRQGAPITQSNPSITNPATNSVTPVPTGTNTTRTLLDSLLGGNASSSDLLKLLSGIFSDYQRNNTANAQLELYKPWQQAGTTLEDMLVKNYQDPTSYLKGPEYQAIQDVAGDYMQRKDAAGGGLANDWNRQIQLNKLALSNLGQYRSTLSNNATAAGAIGTGQGATLANLLKGSVGTGTTTALGSA